MWSPKEISLARAILVLLAFLFLLAVIHGEFILSATVGFLPSGPFPGLLQGSLLDTVFAVLAGIVNGALLIVGALSLFVLVSGLIELLFHAAFAPKDSITS